MDFLSSSTHHYCHSSTLCSSILAGKYQQVSSLSLQSSPERSAQPSYPSRLPGETRHPQVLTVFPSKPNPPSPKKISTNPLRNLVTPSPTTPKNPDNLANKLRLSSEISPSLKDQTEHAQVTKDKEENLNISDDSDSVEVSVTHFRQEGKIFVGNLPLWIKKKEFAEFFRQFGPIKNVILIKGHDDPERNVGYGFVIYGGPTAANSASKAVEFYGVEFHGKTLTVKLDDGRRMKARSEERARWVAGSDEVEYRSKWHEERDNCRREFRRVLESEPDHRQAVVWAFERIDKLSRREFGLLVNYYAKRGGDVHHAREAFERMLGRGIEPDLSCLYEPYSCLCSWSRHGRSIILCEENEARRCKNEFGDIQYPCGRICKKMVMLIK